MRTAGWEALVYTVKKHWCVVFITVCQSLEWMKCSDGICSLRVSERTRTRRPRRWRCRAPSSRRASGGGSPATCRSRRRSTHARPTGCAGAAAAWARRPRSSGWPAGDSGLASRESRGEHSTFDLDSTSYSTAATNHTATQHTAKRRAKRRTSLTAVMLYAWPTTRPFGSTVSIACLSLCSKHTPARTTWAH